MDQHGRAAQENPERRRRQGEDRLGLGRRQVRARKARCLIEATPDHAGRPDHQDQHRQQQRHAHGAMFAQELEIVVVDIGAAARIPLPEITAHARRHVGQAQVLVAPAANAEGRMFLEQFPGRIDMPLRLARDAIGDRRQVGRLHLGRNFLGSEHEHGDADDGQAHGGNDDRLQATGTFDVVSQRLENDIDGGHHRQDGREQNSRARTRVQYREKRQYRRHQRIVGVQPIGALPHRAAPLVRLAQEIRLARVVAPQPDRKGEDHREERASRVWIAEHGEEIDGMLRSFPEHERRARRLLDETEDRQCRAIPHDHLQKDALAFADERVTDRQRRQKRRHEPRQHAHVVFHVHAEREIGNRWSGIGAGGNGGAIAVRAERMVENRHEQQQQKDQHGIQHRIMPQLGPHARTRLYHVLVGAPLREEQEPLQRKGHEPGKRCRQRFGTRAAVDPRYASQREEHEDDDQMAIEDFQNHVKILSSGNIRACRDHRPARQCSRPVAS